MIFIAPCATDRIAAADEYFIGVALFQESSLHKVNGSEFNGAIEL